MLTLYHVRWCPECHLVRRRLDDLGLQYESVLVPDSHAMREQVYAVSGQSYVPVLTDGDHVLTETRDILTYLDERYATTNRDGAG